MRIDPNLTEEELCERILISHSFPRIYEVAAGLTEPSAAKLLAQASPLGTRAARRYRILWLRNRALLAVGIAFWMLLLASPFALVGKDTGWFWRVVGLLMVAALFWLTTTHAMLNSFLSHLKKVEDAARASCDKHAAWLRVLQIRMDDLQHARKPHTQ